MVLNCEMDFGRTDPSCCDDYMFGCIPDDNENSDGAADEIDAVNDETFGGDVRIPNDSELEDYAAQTACLRLDDGAPWDTPGCSKAPAPDASNVPLPDFDIFGPSSFSSFGSETMAKLESLWSQKSHNLRDLWEDQNSNTRNLGSSQSAFVQNEVSNEQGKGSSNYSFLGGLSQVFANAASTSSVPQLRSPSQHAMPHASTLGELERKDIFHQPTSTGKAPGLSAMPTAAVSAADLERRFMEEAALAPNRIASSCNSPFPPPLPSPHAQVPPIPMGPPGFGGVPPMPMPPLLPPLHPMMLPLVPLWLEYLTGRTPCLPPGCPPVPPLLRMFYDTVKDPIVVMDMIRASNAGMVPPPFPPVPPQGFERRTQWQRKAPGMPSGRTIEDLAFDQFAGYMSCKEREWLVKIQIMQCQGTGNPYEDDYYYTNWREKQIAKGWKPKEVKSAESPTEKARENERRVKRVNGSRSHMDVTREPKEVVPLNVKFAGALGLPSKSSTSNPRHLISVEHSLDQGEEDASQRAGKQRRLRTFLLRLESALSLLIECQDRRVRMRSLGHNSDLLLSEISQRIDVVFQDLMTEELVKVLQIGKGRSVVARSIAVGTPKDVGRIVLSLFSVMSVCPRKCLDEMSCDIIPPLLTGLLGLSREQLMALSAALNIDSIKECLSTRNIFCRDAFVTLLFGCSKRKAISQSMAHWLCGPAESVTDFVSGWSSPLSKWRELLPGIKDADLQIFSEWLLLLCDKTHNSLAKTLAKALMSCR